MMIRRLLNVAMCSAGTGSFWVPAGRHVAAERPQCRRAWICSVTRNLATDLRRTSLHSCQIIDESLKLLSRRARLSKVNLRRRSHE